MEASSVLFLWHRHPSSNPPHEYACSGSSCATFSCGSLSHYAQAHHAALTFFLRDPKLAPSAIRPRPRALTFYEPSINSVDLSNLNYQHPLCKMQTSLTFLGFFSSLGLVASAPPGFPSSGNGLWFTKPAGVWTEYLPVGNGYLAGMKLLFEYILI